MGSQLPRFIAVEGPIGVGKTSLAGRLAAAFGCDLVLEQAEENPFLTRFYQDMTSGALPAQLFFLFQRARQIEEMKQSDLFNPVRVADFLMEKDRLFAQLTLAPEELILYDQVAARLQVRPPQPDLVIYLQAPAAVLRQRIRSRGLSHEQRIDDRYLERLVEAYSQFFHGYQDAPLLIVNAEEIDPVHNERDFGELFEQIESIERGRHYYNPVSLV
jgi:deoxyadenosine/deoxycytidine kinase